MAVWWLDSNLCSSDAKCIVLAVAHLPDCTLHSRECLEHFWNRVRRFSDGFLGVLLTFAIVGEVADFFVKLFFVPCLHTSLNPEVEGQTKNYLQKKTSQHGHLGVVCGYLSFSCLVVVAAIWSGTHVVMCPSVDKRWHYLLFVVRMYYKGDCACCWLCLS